MGLFRFFLLPFSLLYGIITFIRNKMFDWHILKSHSFDIPIISVGNLSVGGTGKTPHLEYLVRLFHQNKKIATLSRGYGRKSKGFIVAEQNTPSTNIGDEPRQIKQKFPEITVSVCESRVEGVKKLLQMDDSLDLILLDDAFQHRYIKPGLSILLTDYRKLFTRDFVLPTGRLREFRCGAKRADIIVVSKTPKIFSPIDRKRVEESIRLQAHQKLFFSYIKYGKFTPLPFLTQNYCINTPKSIVLFTGIANPNHLVEYLKWQCKDLTVLKFNDHHDFTVADIEKIKQTYLDVFSKSKILLTTEKDVMRLENTAIKERIQELPIFYLPIEVTFHSNDDGTDIEQMLFSYIKKQNKPTN